MRPIAVFGLGYAGCVTAACLARLGHRVRGFDPDAWKTGCVQQGRAPFYEPGLDETVNLAARSGSLTAVTCLEEALEGVEVALVCVATPSNADGSADLRSLRSVLDQIRGIRARNGYPACVAIRSTVPPGTCDELGQGLPLLSNPEFLREGSAVAGFLHPPLLVIGSSDPEGASKAAALYATLPCQPSFVSPRTAEMIKYACNAFHALKISFANEIGTLSAAQGVDPAEVMQIFCSDRSLNISPAYLRPGMAFGGSCLPKDLRALLHQAARLRLDLPLIEAVLPSNARHLGRAVEAVLRIPEQPAGVLGLAFKQGTDDLRESPAVVLVRELLQRGREVRVFDPQVTAVKDLGVDLCLTLEQFLAESRHVVIALRLSNGLPERVRASGLPVLDLTRMLLAPHSRGAAELVL